VVPPWRLVALHRLVVWHCLAQKPAFLVLAQPVFVPAPTLAQKS